MHIYGIQKDSNDNPICKTAKETQMYRMVFWTLWEMVRAGWYQRMALKHVCYHMWNRSPVLVRCMRQGAQGWCTGMTQRNGMGREVGVEFSMGNTCTPEADSCQCMAKPLQYCKVISLQLKWINLIIKKESFPTPQFKSINSSVLSLLYSPTLTSIHDHWKNHSLD